MPKLNVSTLPNGDELIRMTRPDSFGDRYCQEPECESLNKYGQHVPVPSVYGYQPAGEGFIGWRSACSRKHALSIWQRELAT